MTFFITKPYYDVKARAWRRHASIVACMLTGCITTGTGYASGTTEATSYYEKVKQRVFADPYVERPTYKVSSRNFGKKGSGPKNRLLSAARRSLSSNADFFDFPGGQKLFNANGICFAGRWVIDTPSEFSGAFTSGLSIPLIARASVALSGTHQSDKRAFGLAVKLFPAHKNTTVNVVVMHSLSGVKTRHVLDLTLDNEPELSGLPPLTQIPKLMRIQRDLKRADALTGANKPNVRYRPVSHLVELSDSETSISSPSPPTWLRLKTLTNERVNASDFRDELTLTQYRAGEIRYSIEFAHGDVGNKAKARWRRVGHMTLSESVTSSTCDQSLHFPHPRLRNQ